MKNRTIKYCTVLLLSIVLTLVAVMPMQASNSDGSQWMQALDNNAKLNSLTIVGTHDSGARHSIADVAGKCQTLSIKQQLKIGVRFLDIRLQMVDNKLNVVHSFVDQMTKFDDVLADMAAFVRDNPSEFLIVSLKEDASAKRSNLDFAYVLEEMLLSYAEVSKSQTLPETVGEARGKIHVLARYGGSSIGLPCYFGWADDASFALGDVYIQDNYYISTTEEKLADIHNTYLVAQEQTYALVLNYTSCYFASGFPPIYAGLPAHAINRDTQQVVADGTNGPLGVIVCDFVTTDLANAIIGRNFR